MGFSLHIFSKTWINLQPRFIPFMYKTLSAIFLIALNFNTVFAQKEWKLSKEKEGIKIYTSILPHSKIKAVKVECAFKAKASEFVALLLDVESAKEWVYHTKSCRLIKQVSPSELYYYSEVSVPWPVQNRDFVAHLTVSQHPGTKLITVDGPAVSGFVPLKPGVVRVEHSIGKWLIMPLENDHIQVEYTLHLDPGGSIPKAPCRFSNSFGYNCKNQLIKT
eukprot:gene2991-3437_t